MPWTTLRRTVVTYFILEEGDLPAFAYSIGIQQTSRAPDVIVIGLLRQVAHFVVNEYNSRVRAGESFVPGNLYAGFLEGFDVRFEPVDRSHYHEYLGWARWLNRGDEFDTLQLIYPTTSGVWPWESDASESFRARQPLLGHPREQCGLTKRVQPTAVERCGITRGIRPPRLMRGRWPDRVRRWRNGIQAV